MITVRTQRDPQSDLVFITAFGTDNAGAVIQYTDKLTADSMQDDKSGRVLQSRIDRATGIVQACVHQANGVWHMVETPGKVQVPYCGDRHPDDALEQGD